MGRWNWSDLQTPPNRSLNGSDIGAVMVQDTSATAAEWNHSSAAFVTASDGHLWLNYWPGLLREWGDLGTPPGQSLSTGGGIAAITVQDTHTSAERPYAFVTADDGHLWVNYFTGTAFEWADQGSPQQGQQVSYPAAVTVKDSPSAAERPYVFVAGPPGGRGLWVNYWTGTQWKWANQGFVPGHGDFDIEPSITAITAVSVQDSPTAAERPYAFVQAGDAHLWVNYWTGSAWEWADQGQAGNQAAGVGGSGIGAITVKDTPGAAERPYAFVVPNAGGNLWVNYWTGAKWDWADQGNPPGQPIYGNPDVAASKPAAITVMNTPDAAERPYVFVVDAGGGLWVNWWTGTRWEWADQGFPTNPADGLGIALERQVAAVKAKDTPTAAERPYAFAVGADGHLWVNWWSE